MIKKFENFNDSEMSEDKIIEISNTLKNTSEVLDKERIKLEELITDLEIFTSEENKNDQIDDSYITLKEVNGFISDSITKIDEINSKMSDYRKNGRQYLY